MKLVNFYTRWGNQVSINPDDVSSITSIEPCLCVIAMKNGQNHEINEDLTSILKN